MWEPACIYVCGKPVLSTECAAGRLRRPRYHSSWLFTKLPSQNSLVVFLINKVLSTNSTKIPEMHVLHKVSQVSSLSLLELSTECFVLIRFGGSQISPMCMK